MNPTDPTNKAAERCLQMLVQLLYVGVASWTVIITVLTACSI